MKIKLHHLLLLLSLSVITPAGILSVHGQDASYPNPDAYDWEADKEREKIMYSPGEADPLLNNKVNVSATKDSVPSRSSTPRLKTQAEGSKNSARPSSQEDDSILSFNFLYYLFEKYKLQDMVD